MKVGEGKPVAMQGTVSVEPLRASTSGVEETFTNIGGITRKEQVRVGKEQVRDLTIIELRYYVEST